jgi:hypothetical protein
MTQFRTSSQILSTIWEFENITLNINLNPNYWNQKKPMEFSDVIIWEEIEFIPGCLGIYVSWDPYEEFYAVVFNQFLKNPQGIKIFSGESAAKEVQSFAEKLGCNLLIGKIFIDKKSV